MFGCVLLIVVRHEMVGDVTSESERDHTPVQYTEKIKRKYRVQLKHLILGLAVPTGKFYL